MACGAPCGAHCGAPCGAHASAPAIRSEQGKETLSRGKDGREGKGKEILSKKVMITLQYDTRITPM